MTGRTRALVSKLQQVELMFYQGKTNAEVAVALGMKVRRVYDYERMLGAEDRDPRSKPQRGRPRKIDNRLARIVMRVTLEGQVTTHREVQALLQHNHGVRVTPMTVGRSLKRDKLISCKKKKRPLLTPQHKTARLQFAMAHKDWTIQDWSKVMWSDEKRWPLSGGDGPKRKYRVRGAPLRDQDCIGTVAHGGGGIMA